MSGDVGVIFGTAGATEFQMAVQDPSLRRMEYVVVEHEGEPVLGLVDEVHMRSELSFAQAMEKDAPGAMQYEAHVSVVGHWKSGAKVETPRTPLLPGSTVTRADPELIAAVLGLGADSGGALLGMLSGSSLPVHLDLNTLAQKHLSVLAKTGAGKSYTVGVVLESFLLAGVPMVILDPHGEYGSLARANREPEELASLRKFKLKPRSFQKNIREFAVDPQICPGADPLTLDGLNLDAREIADMLPSKLAGSQVGILYQAVKEVSEENPAYSLHDIRDAIERQKGNAKWTVMSSLDQLLATELFQPRGTKAASLVQPGMCSIINLRGTPPDQQEIIAARISQGLWEARKRGEVLPHILVVEEAHNFCPEKGIGKALSGPILRTIAAEGRKFGLGLFIISQRPAKIDKNVISQCNTQIVLKVTNPNDLKAIVASVEGITTQSADEIQHLNIGSALIAGGGLRQPVLVDVRPRLTRHGGESVDVVGEHVRAGTPVPSAPSPSRAAAKLVERRAPAAKPAAQPPKPAAKPAAAVAPTPPPPARPAPAKASEPAPRAAPAMSPTAARGVHRVSFRMGLVPDQSPEKSVAQLQQWARDKGQSEDHFVSLYGRIANMVCLESKPNCTACPLNQHCPTAKEQDKPRGLRRLWGGS